MNLRRKFFHAAKRILLGEASQRNYTVDPNSTVGEGTIIDDGARLRASKLGRNCSIGENVSVSDCQLADHVTIDGHVRLSNCELDSWVSIQSNTEIQWSSIGAYSYVAKRAMINCSTFGRFCSIGPNVVLGLGEHPTRWISTAPVFYSDRKQCGTSFCPSSAVEELARIEIGNDVWIGANVVIRNGLKIGDGAIIGAGAVVVKDVPPYAVVGGVPAKPVRMRFSPEIIERFSKVKWWEFPHSILKDDAHRWRTENAEEFLIWAERVRAGLQAHGT